VPRSARVEFKPAQQRAVAVLKDGHESELTRGAYEQICGVSRSQAAYDLAELVEAGVLERIGGGRSTRYVLVREPNSSRRHWTSDRIRSELVHFCAGRPAWPSAREFKSAGHTDLYVAASRYGGVAFWADELGLPRAARRWEAPSLPRLRLSLSWAMIGALGGALAVGAAVAIVQGFPRAAPKAVAEHAGSVVATAKSPTAKNSTPRARTSAKRATTAKARAHRRTTTSHAAVAKPSSSASTTPILAVRTVSASPPPPSPPAPSTTSSTRAGTTTTSSSTGSSGPTPLMAPRTGSGTPPPLPPPTR
jgi:hypothetical protein